jgi:hypothetical protein
LRSLSIEGFFVLPNPTADSLSARVGICRISPAVLR